MYPHLARSRLRFRDFRRVGAPQDLGPAWLDRGPQAFHDARWSLRWTRGIASLSASVSEHGRCLPVRAFVVEPMASLSPLPLPLLEPPAFAGGAESERAAETVVTSAP